jgi:ABC-type phosphate/phosphonate transport system ATPase subunit
MQSMLERSAMGPPMLDLSIRGLSKTYSNGVQALKDVTLRIQPGKSGLLGPNGAGKSTLMRTLATLVAVVQRAQGGRPRGATWRRRESKPRPVARRFLALP